MPDTKTETIDEALHRLVVVEGLDPAVAADKALHTVARAKLIDFVRPLVERKAWDMQRSEARRAEHQAFRHLRRGRTLHENPGAPSPARPQSRRKPEPCPHGMPSPGACTECMADGNLIPPPAPVAQTTVNPVEVRRRLALAPFCPARGQRPVTWGEATAEQHRARAEMQEAHAAASAEDASRHLRAAALIESSGVATLDDVDDWSPLFEDAA